MKNVSEMNNGSLYSIIFCFLNIVPPLAFPLKNFPLLPGSSFRGRRYEEKLLIYSGYCLPFFIVLKLTGACKYVEYEYGKDIGCYG